jgi:hypothetical protein
VDSPFVDRWVCGFVVGWLLSKLRFSQRGALRLQSSEK